MNSISANNFEKMDSLRAFNAVWHYDLICLSETFLNSSFSTDNVDLFLDGYNMIRSDHPNNIRRGGVCLYFKDSLPLKILSVSDLSECLAIEVAYEKKKCVFISLYRSPSQDSDDFESFLIKFEHLIDNAISSDPDLVLILGDFNAKLSSWCGSDIDTLEGIKINDLTSSYGLSQLISEPTHILPNSSSCIDLIFCSHPNMISNSGVHPSLYPSCHHQMIFAKLDFNVFVPPPYERHIWHYNKANIDEIRRAIFLFDWDNAFRDNSVDRQVEIFNRTLINIFKNYTPNEMITIDEKDPPWLTNFIKSKILEKNTLYNNFILNGSKNEDYHLVLSATNNINKLINNSKCNYYSRLSSKLSNSKTHPKAYWSILKSLFSNKKLPKIPPLLVDDAFISDFKVKASMFNSYFAKQCSVLSNGSVLPEQVHPFQHSFSSVDLSEELLLMHIRSLDVCKSHGHDGISARMIKMCDISIVKPLIAIFKNCIHNGVFPSSWKKANITPIHKKGDKCKVSNYRPISVLPICAKLFEKLIYINLYEYISSNNILNINQSGFREGDSCTNQLSVIVHEILKAFDSNPTLEVRGVFLDISKAFDRVWHEGLIYKLKCIGIKDNALKVIESFLNNRFQRVVLNGQSSDWESISAGVPQGSILGPLLFLTYINDITLDLDCNVKLFADDTCLFSTVTGSILSATNLNSDLEKIQQWAYQWKMSFNPDLSKQAQEVIFSKKRLEVHHPNLYFDGSIVQKSSAQKHLGVILDEKLSFNQHLKYVIDKASKGIGVLRKLRFYIPRSSLLTIYKSFIRSHLDYADVIYDQPYNASFCEKIESIQYNAALAMTGAIRGTSKDKLYKELGLEYLSLRRWSRRLCLFYKILNNKSPLYMQNLVPCPNNLLITRNRHQIPFIFCRTEAFSNSFYPYCIKEWRILNPNIRQSETFDQFKRSILKIIRPIQNSIFDVVDHEGVRLLSRLRLGLSHLNKHKFSHGFLDTVNPMCSCNSEEESVSHYLLRCPNFVHLRNSLMNELINIDQSLNLLNHESLTNILLYGSKQFNYEVNSKIIKLTINFIKLSERFSSQLF